MKTRFLTFKQTNLEVNYKKKKKKNYSDMTSAYIVLNFVNICILNKVVASIFALSCRA